MCSIRNWYEGKGLAIDIAVMSPFSAQHLKAPNQSPCEHYADQYKHAKYDKDFEGSEYLFSAIVWETTGAVNAEGEEVLRQIMRYDTLKPYSVYYSIFMILNITIK